MKTFNRKLLNYKHNLGLIVKVITMTFSKNRNELSLGCEKIASVCRKKYKRHLKFTKLIKFFKKRLLRVKSI